MQRRRNAHATSESFWMLLLVALALYFVLLMFFDRTLFSPRPGRIQEEPDGFEMTILALLDDDGGTPLWLLARFAVIFPLLSVEDTPVAALLQGLYLLVYSLPVVLWAPPQSRRSALQLVLLFIPVFVSFRLAIAIYSVACCLMFMVDRRLSPWLFLWYGFATFLSSSTMFILLLAFPLLLRTRLRDCSWLAKSMLWLLYFAVASEFVDKLFALFVRSLAGEVLSTASEAGLDYSGSATGFAMAMLTGNPFFTALVFGQYDRLLLLIPSVIGATVIVIRLWNSENRKVLGFTLILLASMLSEGVGSYSVGVVLFLVLVHWKAIVGRRKPKPRAPRTAAVPVLPAPAGLLAPLPEQT